jgi:hypothetical protein
MYDGRHDKVLRIPIGSAKTSRRCVHLGFLMRKAVLAWADDQSSTAAAPAVVTATAKNDPNEIQCKKMQVTGQLLPGPKVCHTRAQWEGIQRQSQEEAERAQDTPGSVSSK